jgi:hypothetical protein
MLSIYAPPTFDEATRTLGIWLTFHKPPSSTLPATLRPELQGVPGSLRWTEADCTNRRVELHLQAQGSQR